MGKYSATRGLDLSVHTRWYLLASRTEALVFKDSPQGKFRFVERIFCPDGSRTEAELDSDRPGRSFSSGAESIRHSLDRRFSKHEQAAVRFAEMIGQSLAESRRMDRFSELVIAAEPHFLGLLRRALPNSVKNRVSHEIARQYSQAPMSEIREQILDAISE